MADAPIPPAPPMPPPMVMGAPPPSAYAHWGQRVAAALIDAIVPLPFYLISGIGVAMLLASARTSYDAQGNEVLHVDMLGWVGVALIVIGYLAALVFSLWNGIVRQGRTGWSIGKKVMGIRLVSIATGQPLGIGLTFVRQLAHFFDGLACYLGFLWPLWDDKRQTFADKLLSSVVVPSAEPAKR